MGIASLSVYVFAPTPRRPYAVRRTGNSAASNSGSREHALGSERRSDIEAPRRGAEASARFHVTTPDGAVVDDHRGRHGSARPMGLRRERPLELTAVGGHMIRRLGSSVRRVVSRVHPLAHVSRSLVLVPELDGVANGNWIRPLRGLVAVPILDSVDVDAEQALPQADALVDLIPHPLAREGVGTDQDGSHRTLGKGSVDELLDRIVAFRDRGRSARMSVLRRTGLQAWGIRNVGGVCNQHTSEAL